MKKLLLYIVLIYCFQLQGQEHFIIKNVRLFDGELVQENVSVEIKEGKVARVSNKEIKGINTIDGSGKTLIPGMTNCHVHVWSPFSLTEAVKAGVLNLLDMHAVEAVMPSLIDLRSSTNHADYYAAGAAATVPGGHGTQYGFPTPTLTKPSEAKEFISGRIAAGAHYIKIIKEPWKATLDSLTVASLITEAHKQNRKAVVHVSRNHNALEVVRSGADGLVHIWRDSIMNEKQFNALKKHKFFVVPTMIVRKLAKKHFDDNNIKVAHITEKELKKEVFRLYKAEIPILAGTDPPNLGLNYGTDLYRELILMQEAGIPTIAVLKSATSLPAKYFNLEGKGFLKEGYRADMVLVDGNPTKDIKAITNSKRIWKLGKEIK